MSVVINTNSAATIASNNLSASNAMLQRSLNRLSSGSKIVSAADDAGGVAVASKLSASAKRSGVVSQNIANAVSFLQRQDSSLKTVGKMLERMSELNTLALDNTKDTTDKGLYAMEFNELAAQVTNVLDQSQNGRKLLKTTVPTVGSEVIGSDFSVTVNDAGTNSYTTATSVTTHITAAAALTASTDCGTTATATKLASAITEVAGLRAQNGASQSVLGYYGELNQSSKANFESAISKITDVDVAEESTQLARWNTLVQAGTAMVAQANASTQSVLTLLR